MIYYTTVNENVKKHIESDTFKSSGYIELYSSKQIAECYSHPLDKYYVEVEIPRDSLQEITETIVISDELFNAYKKSFSEVKG